MTMDLRKFSKTKTSSRGNHVKSSVAASVDSSSSEEKSDGTSYNGGSGLRLFQDKRKSFKTLTKSRDATSTNATMRDESIEPVKASQVSRESSFAQSIKRRFSFFRKSESVKSSEDVEAGAIIDENVSQKSDQRLLDVIVDVHHESEEQKRRPIKRSVPSKPSDDTGQSDDVDNGSISEKPDVKSLDLIEKFDNEQSLGKSQKNNLFESDSDTESEIDILPERENNVSIEELSGEIMPTSGGESRRRRRRWRKSEIATDSFVEDLKKPRRRQWTKESVSADVHQIGRERISLPQRSVTDDLLKSTNSRSPITSTPIPAPRSKSLQKIISHRAFDNEGFSTDQDEILRIETINDSSPKIQIGETYIDKKEDGACTLSGDGNNIISDSNSHIEEIKDRLPVRTDSTDNSEIRDQTLSESSRSVSFVEKKKISRKRSDYKQNFLDDEKCKIEKEDEIDKDGEEQETVLSNLKKKSIGSSYSSRVEMIPSNFFRKKSNDETTITTNDDMNTSGEKSHHVQGRYKSKPSRHKKSDDTCSTSDRSLRVKPKTTSASTRHSMEEYSSSQRKENLKTRKIHKKKEHEQTIDVNENMKYISVRIHQADVLEVDFITRHPMVKVHIVYTSTGEYLKSRNKEKNVNELLQAIVTGKFDFREKQSMVPIWKEELIFEQDFQDLIKEGKESVLILFEIVDLLNFSEASACYDQLGGDDCWYKVAWGFLRPVGVGGIHHVEKKLRLQLYRPKKNLRKSKKNLCEVYRWWKSNSRDKYPSSLYVSLSAVDPPKLEPVFYELTLHKEAIGDALDPEQEDSPLSRSESRIEPPKWTRLAAQSCQIPNEMCTEVEASENGCFHLAFSNDGKYLACALSEEYDYPILIYKVHDGKIHVRFSGHKNFIYSLSWSQNNRFLLSVSSDLTARFWDVQEKIIEPIQSLPHPSYVYCGKFSLDISNYIVTGCYDRVARIWARLRTEGNEQYELVQELELHESFINSVCFQPKSEGLFTGDGVGVIIAWLPKKSRKSPIRKEWQIARKIKVKELEGVPINSIIMHPLGFRLLVHSRNNGLRLMDLRSGAVIKKYDGLMNQRIQITACISPCGNLLFCGGEDSVLNVWNLQSGKRLAVYKVGVHEKAVTCVDYHPNDHALAYAVYGAPVPVKILKFDREVDGSSVGLKLLVTAIDATSKSFIPKPVIQFASIRNGVKTLQTLPTRSRSSSLNVSQYSSVSHLPKACKNKEEVRVHLMEKTNKIMENGPNLKVKSVHRLNGIIEKIDRILMYATAQKSPALDVESARDSSIFTISDRQTHKVIENIELQDSAIRATVHKTGRIKKTSRKHHHRSRSARNSYFNIHKETEFSKAFSDSATNNCKFSKCSEDSSNSSQPLVSNMFVVERLNLEKIDCVDTESGFKDSLDTIIDGKEILTSEENLDIESLKSDDTYVINTENKPFHNRENDFSDESSATFIIKSKIPIPKPRKKIDRMEVM